MLLQLGPEDLEVKNYWCGVCEKEYPSAGSLKIHLSRAHSQVKWCYTCTKVWQDVNFIFSLVIFWGCLRGLVILADLRV